VASASSSSGGSDSPAASSPVEQATPTEPTENRWLVPADLDARNGGIDSFRDIRWI